uniref:Uncharacterized protein n=1 Tax=Lepeophtheirus salmonis TaxID=72036 RepID=A0A0K2UHL1_LEPSM
MVSSNVRSLIIIWHIFLLLAFNIQESHSELEERFGRDYGIGDLILSILRIKAAIARFIHIITNMTPRIDPSYRDVSESISHLPKEEQDKIVAYIYS